MEPIFDHEKLDVYGLQLQFVAWTADFLIEASQSPVPHRRELLDQLDRACLSILLNTAELNLSVAENIFFGMEPRTAPAFVDRKKLKEISIGFLKRTIYLIFTPPRANLLLSDRRRCF